MKLKLFFLIAFLLTLKTSYSQEIIEIQNRADSINKTKSAQLFVYLPNDGKQKHPLVLICPGGGYGKVNMPYEGDAFAKWMQSKGFVAIALKYRLPHGNPQVPFDDATSAMDLIRENVNRWNIDTEKIGIVGFSAGGNLASVFTNRIAGDQTYLQPAFSILFYPVTSMLQPTRGTSQLNLLGKNPSMEKKREYSAQFLVTDNTPPTIIFVSNNDAQVPPLANSLTYFDSLKQKNIPSALYVFPSGGHGWAMHPKFVYDKYALLLLDEWLRDLKII